MPRPAVLDHLAAGVQSQLTSSIFQLSLHEAAEPVV